MELKQYLRILKKRWWIIAACVVVATTVAGVYSYYFIEPVYQASTKLIVNKSKDFNVLGAAALDMNSINMDMKLIDTYKEIIRTPAIMDKVAEQYPDLQLSSDALIGKIGVSSVNNTQVMTLSAQDLSYDKAAAIVNAVSKVFKQEIPSIMNVDNVSILNEAQPRSNPSPVKPNPVMNMMISLVVSLMAGVGIIVLLDYLDDTLKTEQDVEEVLGYSTLSVIARIKKDDVTPKSSNTSTPKVGEPTYVAVNK